MDHQYSQHNSFNERVCDMMYEEHIGEIDAENTTVSNISVPEKVGDNYLIKLYRERQFLYDKNHQDFKDNELKNNAWKEISSIMIDENFGDFYTAEYCKKRLTNLREQYVKLKKNQDLKSGRTACIKKKFALLSKLSFLDVYIQRRRTFTNIKENIKRMPTSSFNKNVAECPKTNIVKSINLKKRNHEEVVSSQNDIEENLSKNLCNQPPFKILKKNISLKKNNDNDEVRRHPTTAVINIATQLQSDSKSTKYVVSSSVEHAFAEFIALYLQKMEEPERSIRRNKIFHALTAPLQQLL